MTFDLGKGDGTFAQNSTFWISLDSLLHLVGADFNGDGRMDLAVLSSTGATILVQESGLTPSVAALYINGYLHTPTAPQTVTFTNISSANDTVSSAGLGGTNAGDFAISSDACTGSTLAPNGTCTLSVTFEATDMGSRIASLAVRHSASNAALAVLLSGSGRLTTVGLNPVSLSFGSQQVGNTSAAQSLNVTNTGGGDLIVSGVSFSSTNSGDFAKSADTCTGVTIPPNGTCTISVTFTPPVMGSRNAMLNITYDRSTTGVTLTGIGAVTNATLSPTSLSFSPQMVNTASAPQTETVKNTGTANLVIVGIPFSGTNSNAFAKTADTCTGANLAPDATCTFGVTLTPTTMGNQSASWSLNDNAFNNPDTVPLTGTGIGPVITL